MKTLFLLFLSSLFLTAVHAQAGLNYAWDNVKIGGGGYMTGMKIHPMDEDIMYLRTDVGGAYRWNKDKEELEQIINLRNSNYYGVAGIAIHPTNKDIVYLAVDRGNDASASAILKSTDRGDTWQVIATNNFKFGANGGRTGTSSPDRDREGSPIAINPDDINELWVGSRGKGLWRLNGTSWTRIVSGTIPDNNAENSIRNVLFDTTNSDVIYVSYYRHGVYRSSNGGQSFQLISGNDSELLDVSDISLSSNGTKLYAACRNKGVFKLESPKTSTNWINTNVRDSEINYGYLTVTASPHDDNYVVANTASTGGFNFPRLLVSTDGGEGWSRKNDITLDTIFKWNSGDSEGPHCSQLTFHPTDANKLFYTSFSGLWHTDNINAAQVAWRNDMARGHEEIVPTGLIAFPQNAAGNDLMVNSADHIGWTINEPSDFPENDIVDLVPQSGDFKKGAGSAVCEKQPENIVVSSTVNWIDTNGFLFISKDSGGSFNLASGYQVGWGKANVAMASNDPSNIVVVCSAGVKYSTDGGASFSTANNISGIAAENNIFFSFRPLVADPEVNHTFYIYDRRNGDVYRSTNKGANWSLQGRISSFTHSGSNPEGNSTRLLSVFGHEGHLWINHVEKGIRRSVNGGASWSSISNVEEAEALAIGAGRNTGDYPALYLYGKLTGDTERWFYRSTDEGASWERINHEDNIFLGEGIKHMVADRTKFGAFYVGSSGLGIWSGSEVDSPFIKVTNPAGGESLTKGSAYQLKWDSNMGGDVRVVLFKGANYYDTIVSSIPSSGSFTWNLDASLPVGNDFTIRVRSNDNLDEDDYSLEFSIVEASTGYNDWLNDNGITDSSDPDSDQISNLLEYVLNGDPERSDPEILPVINQEAGEMYFEFTRLIASTADTSQVFQYGTDVDGWTDININTAANTAVTITNNSATMQTVKIRMPNSPAGENKMFSRLKVTIE